MATFKINQSLETTDSQLEVETVADDGPTGPTTLNVGNHRFKLVVVNDKGVQSEPVIATVRVVRPVRPIIDRDDRPPIIVDRKPQPPSK